MFLNYHSYETRTRADCRWESHRRYIDLQYVLAGSEWVDWSPAGDLVAAGGYDSVMDRQDYLDGESPATQQSVRLNAGSFVIFFPEDAHRPQIADGEPQTLWKAVVKVEWSLLEGDEVTEAGK
jgi:YhcH/YjgK/YiaL family protein